MITERDKKQLIHGILNNSLNNNIYSRRAKPDIDLVDLLVRFAKEEPYLLVKALKLHSKYGVHRKLKYYVFASLALAENKQYCIKSLNKYINTLRDIHDFTFFLESDEADSSGFWLSKDIKVILRNKLSKITETDLLPYFNYTKQRKLIDIKKLLRVLKPDFKNQNVDKAFKILVGANSKEEINKTELPKLWALRQIENEKDPRSHFITS